VGLHYNASRDAAQAVLDGITEAGGEAVLVKADICIPAETIRAVAETVAAFGRLDGLINNAGGMVRRVTYADVTDADYDQVMDLNARSVLVASKAAIPHLKTAGGGFIINTTSVAARNGASGGAGLYGSSKAFVSNVTRGMA
jgi:3-oxoacyl-[acyl-carrier protein] reductase